MPWPFFPSARHYTWSEPRPNVGWTFEVARTFQDISVLNEVWSTLNFVGGDRYESAARLLQLFGKWVFPQQRNPLRPLGYRLIQCATHWIKGPNNPFCSWLSAGLTKPGAPAAVSAAKLDESSHSSWLEWHTRSKFHKQQKKKENEMGMARAASPLDLCSCSSVYRKYEL